jgi:hypothetical protein
VVDDPKFVEGGHGPEKMGDIDGDIRLFGLVIFEAALDFQLETTQTLCDRANRCREPGIHVLCDLTKTEMCNLRI